MITTPEPIVNTSTNGFTLIQYTGGLVITRSLNQRFWCYFIPYFLYVYYTSAHEIDAEYARDSPTHEIRSLEMSAHEIDTHNTSAHEMHWHPWDWHTRFTYTIRVHTRLEPTRLTHTKWVCTPTPTTPIDNSSTTKTYATYTPTTSALTTPPHQPTSPSHGPPGCLDTNDLSRPNNYATPCFLTQTPPSSTWDSSDLSSAWSPRILGYHHQYQSRDSDPPHQQQPEQTPPLTPIHVNDIDIMSYLEYLGEIRKHGNHLSDLDNSL